MNQDPCAYQVEYTAYLFNEETLERTDLPTFIVFDLETKAIEIDLSSDENKGSYTIGVEVEL